MQWNPQHNAGFTNGTPWLEIPDNYRSINVESEEKDPDSILNYYRTLVRLRKEYAIIAEGEIRFLETGNGRVFAYERSLDGQRLTVVCNFGGQNETASVALNPGTVLLCNGKPDQLERLQNGALTLRPYEAFAVLNRM